MTQENNKIQIAKHPEPGEALESHLRPVLDYLTKTKGSHEFYYGDHLRDMRYYSEVYLSGRYLDVKDLNRRFDFPDTIKVYETGITDKENAIEITLHLKMTELERKELSANILESNEKYLKDPSILLKQSLGTSD